MEKGTSRRREKEGGPAGGGVIRERCGRSCGQPFQESEKGIAAVSNAQPGVSGRRTNTDRTGGLGEPVSVSRDGVGVSSENKGPNSAQQLCHRRPPPVCDWTRSLSVSALPPRQSAALRDTRARPQ